MATQSLRNHPALAGALALILLSCAPSEAKEGLGPAEPSPVVALQTTPSSVGLAVGQSVNFAATARHEDGSTSSIPTEWAASGGTISPAGSYTAGSVPGSFAVVGSSVDGEFADTSAVTISAAQLQAVVLSPGSVSLSVGAVQQFTVSGQWSNGATTPPSVTYSATGGTITGGGLYTAGSGVGSYRVIATQTGGTLADTVVVLITQPGPGWLAHKPATFTNVIADYGFDAPIPSATSDQPMGDGSLWNVYYPTSARTTNRIMDTTGGVSPQYAVQTQYEIGDMGGVGKVKFYTDYLSGSITQFYIALRVKWDAGYEWNDISNKLFYVEPGNIVLQSRHNVGGIQRYLSVYVGAYDDDWMPDNNIQIPEGQWVTIEFLVKRSTTAGELQVWLNGIETMHKRNIRVPTTSSSQRLDINDTWGGGGGPRVRNSYRWLDHVYIATP